jgi:hypothetical protein
MSDGKENTTCLDFDTLPAAWPLVGISALALVVAGVWPEALRGEARSPPATCSGTLASHRVLSDT